MIWWGLGCAALAAVAVWCACAHRVLIRNLRRAREELHGINAQPNTNRLLHGTLTNRELEALLCEVNATLTARRAGDIAHRRQERALKEQIANISHDLRTPLTSILGYVELMGDAALEPAQREAYRQIVLRRARVLQTLIQSFYDLSRLEAGDYALKHEPVALYACTCEIVAAFYQELTDRGFDVQLHLDETAPDVWADENAVVRVLTNLLQNALRHGEAALRIALQRRGDAVELCVENRAPHMDAAQIAHVFDRSFTGDETRTAQDTGLGLTIAQQLIVRMHGRIEAAYEAGWFSITFALPAV